MDYLIVSAIGVFILGITTTLHPCPFSTNIAAVSIITGNTNRWQNHRFTIAGFVLGYVLSFIVLASLIIHGLIAIPSASLFLQRATDLFLGPIMILVGMALSKMINLNRFYSTLSLSRNYWITRGSFFASLILGMILALTFCPATASVFFGLMIPLSVQSGQAFLFPLIYASGAIIPIITIVLFIRKGISLANKHWLNRIPDITGWFLIILGIYVSLDTIFL